MLPPGWKEVRFADAIDFQEGPGILAKDFRDNGVPLIRLAGLEHGARVLDGCNYLDETMVAAKWSHFRVREGDVLLSTSASLGRTATVDASSAGAIPYTGIIRMRPRNSELNPSFIPYLLQSPHFQLQIEQMGAGSVIRHFGPTHLRHMSAILPDPHSQAYIVRVLGALDDKTELNRRMNETLEAMARAIFKSWFVDFDPVKAKAEGRHPAGMDAETAALFPSRFVDSELGPIPEGWQVERLGDVIELKYGRALPATQRAMGRVPVFGSNGQIGWHDSGTAFGPAVIVGRKGYPGRVKWTLAEELAVIDTAFQAIDRRWGGAISFTYQALESADLAQLSVDSAVPGLSRAMAERHPILCPSQPVVEAFERVARVLFQRITAGSEENTTLAAIRDTLLPKLMSGELHIPDAEARSEEAVA